ncbi:MAG: NADH-quinone oxidoreductase subunit C [Candidatus Omnitrophica bacterium]|nr:NADH-quinone oxidoreductase subunit C [Candidatus Omnitrophota bacterium]
MNNHEYIKNILDSEKIGAVNISAPYRDELYVTVTGADFGKVCSLLHKRLDSAVMTFFAEDMRARSGSFTVYCAFLSVQARSWIFVRQDVPGENPEFVSIAKDIYSAALFERETNEMFGITPLGNPDIRSLRLHDEVWPRGFYPLRKDFVPPAGKSADGAQYQFRRVEGEGIFEVPVGPVHAGIIGPGHFRFSAAGEPVINLEIRLGWTHRGIEKLLEGKDHAEAVNIVERISGDTAFGYSLAFCNSVEKMLGPEIPVRAQVLRVLYLELERLYNHANDMGGIALDVGFSFPAQFASLIKESILRLNENLSGSRYLKGINIVGGVEKDIDKAKSAVIDEALTKIEKDILALEDMLFSSISFMDRVDATGILRTQTARDLGITGVAARASGIGLDLRKAFPDIYGVFSFAAAKEHRGDVASRFKVRCFETKESISLIHQSLKKLDGCGPQLKIAVLPKEGTALGSAEAWRGPVLVWTRLGAGGKIERCKITDPSFRNWEGLSYAVLGNIIPDFPLCNKSFDLSYPGNDL